MCIRDSLEIVHNESNLKAVDRATIMHPNSLGDECLDGIRRDLDHSITCFLRNPESLPARCIELRH